MTCLMLGRHGFHLFRDSKQVTNQVRIQGFKVKLKTRIEGLGINFGGRLRSEAPQPISIDR